MALRRSSNRSKSGDTSNTKPKQGASKQATLFNRLTWVFFILTVIVSLCYLLIFLIPTTPLNPFQPYTMAVEAIASTLTPQPTYTPHPTSTSTSTPTNTPRPTFTPTDTSTPKPTLDLRKPISATLRAAFLATSTPMPTPTPTIGPTMSPFNYTAEVLYQRAQLYGTNWSGIAGLIFGLDMKHQPGLGVKAWGDEPLGPDGQLLPSGTAPQYGPSGWEFTLGDKPISGKYNVQLLGPTGEALSPIVEIELKGDPRANLAYIIFRQNH